jgi:zinc/manganese transport system substrate-binding protein
VRLGASSRGCASVAAEAHGRVVAHRQAIGAALAVVLAVAGCGGGSVAPGEPMILATTSIVGDLVSQVVGDDARVEVIIPVGADPHDFAPSARQAASLREADLVVTSGLGLEAGLDHALQAAAQDGTPILELGPALDPRPLGGSESGPPDPHWWLDPVRAADAVRLIGDRLGQVAAGDWQVRATGIAGDLEALDGELRSSLAAVPSGHRTLITGHDAFRYFAQHYDFKVIGVLVPGGATQAQADPRALAQLAAVIRAEGVPAIFAETTVPTNVADALAAEVGAAVCVVVLYTGSLGVPGSGADTYAGMMRTNVARIVEALG